MKRYELARAPRAVVTEVTCDRCGADMVYDRAKSESHHGPAGEVLLSCGATFAGSFGFGSRRDMETWRFELCDECATLLKDWLGTEPQHTESGQEALYRLWNAEAPS